LAILQAVAEYWDIYGNIIPVGRLPNAVTNIEKKSQAMHILEHLFLVGEFPSEPTYCPG